MARTVTYVTTEEVRDWARENDWRDEKGREVAERGRMSTKLINDYNKANKRHFKQYDPITRRPQGQAAPTATASSRQQDSAPAPRKPRETASVSTDAPSDRIEDSNGVNSLSDVIAMLQAAEKRGGKGRPAVVTIQTLVNV